MPRPASAPSPEPPQTGPVTVECIDDDSGIRAALGRVIAADPGLSWRGGHASLGEYLAAPRETPPQVVLMDLQLGPRMDGILATTVVRHRHPGTAVLVLTLFDDSATVFAALEAGACGYLLKNTAGAELRDAIRSVAAGGAPMTASVARRVIEHFHRQPAPPPPATPAAQDAPDPAPATLTPRERDLLVLLGQGQRYSDVAAVMGISVNTVRTHIRKVYAKLHAQCLQQALIAARKHGFVG